MSVLRDDVKLLREGFGEFKNWLAPPTLSGRLMRMAPVGVGLGLTAGVVVPAITDNAPVFQPSAGGGPSLAHELLNAHNEGTRRMTAPPIGYGTAKFGGVRLETVKTAGAATKAIDLVQQAAQGKGFAKLLPWAVPIIGGGLLLEAMDPLSEVFSPIAKDLGTRFSQNMGYAETSSEQAMQKGIDAFAAQAAKELATGMAGSIGGGMRAGVDLFRPGTPLQTMIQGDPVLSRATPGQQQLLAQSFGAMQRVAPQLSREPFVTKNYLRDVLITNNGPDHATLSSLAKSEQTIMDARGGGRRR